MIPRTNRRALTVGVIGAATLLLAACGGSHHAATVASAGGATSTAVAPAGAQATPSVGGTTGATGPAHSPHGADAHGTGAAHATAGDPAGAAGGRASTTTDSSSRSVSSGSTSTQASTTHSSAGGAHGGTKGAGGTSHGSGDPHGASSVPSPKPGGAATVVSTSSTATSAPAAQAGVPFRVPIVSMAPTYPGGSTVYYDPTATSPSVGQVIVFYFPVGVNSGQCGNEQGPGEACRDPTPTGPSLGIARVAGLAGDSISISPGGHVVRNGQPVSEPYITPCTQTAECDFPNPITVPSGDVYVMADDRNAYSDDSRVFGAVPQRAILGTVISG